MNLFIKNKKIITATLCLLISVGQASAISLRSVGKSTISAIKQTFNSPKTVKAALALSATVWVVCVLLPFIKTKIDINASNNDLEESINNLREQSKECPNLVDKPKYKELNSLLNKNNSRINELNSLNNKIFIKNTAIQSVVTGAIYAMSPLALNLTYIYPPAAACAIGLSAYKLGKMGLSKAKKYLKKDEY